MPRHMKDVTFRSLTQVVAAEGVAEPLTADERGYRQIWLAESGERSGKALAAATGAPGEFAIDRCDL